MVPLDIPAGQGRRLAAQLHSPEGGNKGRAVLIINPLGQEAVRAHRLLRVLADRLARQGVDVLRFDLHGCGDSSGADADGEMDGWQNDVLVAHRWLLDNTGAKRIGWLGIRLGFALGWLAAARFGQAAAEGAQASAAERCRALLTQAPAPDRLIGWDPVVMGQRYLEALWEDHRAALSRAFSLPTVPDRQLRQQSRQSLLLEAMGFELSPQLVRQIRTLDRQDWRKLPLARVAVLMSNAALPWPDAQRAAGLQLECVDVDFDWTSEEALNTPLVPDQALRRLIPWLSEEAHG